MVKPFIYFFLFLYSLTFVHDTCYLTVITSEQLAVLWGGLEYHLAKKLMHRIERLEPLIHIIEELLPSTKHHLDRVYQEALSFAKAYRSEQLTELPDIRELDFVLFKTEAIFRKPFCFLIRAINCGNRKNGVTFLSELVCDFFLLQLFYLLDLWLDLSCVGCSPYT